jgi:hypothetical protein
MRVNPFNPGGGDHLAKVQSAPHAPVRAMDNSRRREGRRSNSGELRTALANAVLTHETKVEMYAMGASELLKELRMKITSAVGWRRYAQISSDAHLRIIYPPVDARAVTPEMAAQIPRENAGNDFRIFAILQRTTHSPVRRRTGSPLPFFMVRVSPSSTQ